MITDQVMDFWNDLESLEVLEKSNILVKMFKTLIKLAFNYLTFWVLIFHALYYRRRKAIPGVAVIIIIYHFV